MSMKKEGEHTIMTKLEIKIKKELNTLREVRKEYERERNDLNNTKSKRDLYNEMILINEAQTQILLEMLEK